MSLSYDASGHKLSVLFNRVPFDIIIISLRSDRAVVLVCALATGKLWDFRAVLRQRIACLP